jgi:hypothetical protein
MFGVVVFSGVTFDVFDEDVASLNGEFLRIFEDVFALIFADGFILLSLFLRLITIGLRRNVV